MSTIAGGGNLRKVQLDPVACKVCTLKFAPLLLPHQRRLTVKNCFAERGLVYINTTRRTFRPRISSLYRDYFYFRPPSTLLSQTVILAAFRKYTVTMDRFALTLVVGLARVDLFPGLFVGLRYGPKTDNAKRNIGRRVAGIYPGDRSRREQC